MDNRNYRAQKCVSRGQKTVFYICLKNYVNLKLQDRELRHKHGSKLKCFSVGLVQKVILEDANSFRITFLFKEPKENFLEKKFKLQLIHLTKTHLHVLYKNA